MWHTFDAPDYSGNMVRVTPWRNLLHDLRHYGLRTSLYNLWYQVRYQFDEV
jgi:hypothetical protein